MSEAMLKRAIRGSKTVLYLLRVFYNRSWILRYSAAVHLKALARISRLLKDKFFRQALKEAKTAEDVKKIITEEDEY